MEAFVVKQHLSLDGLALASSTPRHACWNCASFGVNCSVLRAEVLQTRLQHPQGAFPTLGSSHPQAKIKKHRQPLNQQCAN